MTTFARPVRAVDGARKILTKISPLLPVETRWSLEGRDDADEMYFLTLYCHIEDAWSIREAARTSMADLLEKGVTLVLLFEDPDVLPNLGDSVETFPVGG